MNLLYKCILSLMFFCYIEAQFALRCPYPYLQHGKARLRTKSRIVKFVCNPRYKLVGNKYSICRMGRWEEQLPVCVKSGCPKLPPITNGIQMTHHDGAWLMTFCLPNYRLEGSEVLYCNGYRWNSTAPKCVEMNNNVTTIKYSCDFEEDLCGWIQDEFHDFDWKRLNTKTPSSFTLTGPWFDHTYGSRGKGHFMYIESTGRFINDTARLLSPIYDSAIAKDGCFQLYYHMYGRSLGGLRVYQKPDSVDLMTMLASEEQRKDYIIFEKWGEQGDLWLSAAPRLKDFNEDFQIVIEGIRGSSFMSDLAIDDISVLRGQKCVDAAAHAITPSPYKADSCVGRCFQNITITRGCGCDGDCVIYGYCCQDFVDLCIEKDPETTVIAETGSTVALPQTQKLVASTTNATTSTSTTTTTTPKPIVILSTKTTTTTASPKPTTPTTTSTKTFPTIPTRTTTITVSKTPKTSTKTTIARRSSSPSQKQTTKVLKPTTQSSSITPKSATRKVTSVASTTVGSKKLTSSTTVKPASTSKKVTEKQSFTKKMTVDVFVAKKSKGASKTLQTSGIIVGVLFCVFALVGSVVAWRRYGGMMIVRRLRGQIANDPEVRYLSAHMDD
ncbi:scavenger receptor type C isoform X1 [Bombyx mori]|uniref:Uncharacterized protein n=1 Tax=Bombyx mori TaxID=7091 RepID=A0A8R2R687_BOMMO|nr:scavenger receptor type C isoform X1 [Bombyx mori]